MCTSPNFMSFEGYEWTGQPIWKFLGRPDNYDEFVKLHGGFEKMKTLIQVPCGKCDECLAERARHWAERCSLEAKNSKFNYFVTLTYNDDNLPKDGLNKKHLQNFMHFLRKLMPGIKIRFFGCGEYGSNTFRPHFHVLLFNCPLSDLSDVFYEEVDGQLKAHTNVELDFRCQYSDTIHRAWNRKGNISVAPFTFATACYVSQYVTKKNTKELNKFYKMFSCTPEYIVMSRRPGIGGNSLDDADYENDYIMVPGDGKAHISSIPRYFDKVLIRLNGEEWFNENVRVPRQVKKHSRVMGLDHKGFSLQCECDYRAQKLRKLKHERQIL